MIKRFFKKLMPEENTNQEAAVEAKAPGVNPGVEVTAGPQVPGVDLTQGTTSPPAQEAPAPEAPVAPVPEAPTPQEPKPEAPVANDETTAAVPAVDPMKPVGPN